MESANFSESDLMTFDDAAAGHDGMLVDPSKTLIFKPCTSTEVGFYQESQQHPEFLEHIPNFIGTLQRQTGEQWKEALRQQDPMALGAALQAAEGDAEKIAIEGDASNDGTSASSAAKPDTVSAAVVPSRSIHGKALDTSLLMVLENVASGFKKPNVMDVKLGARLWGDDAPPEKRARLDQVSGETTSKDLGFRVAGMRCWNPTKKETEIFDKWYGRKLTVENVKSAFETFFHSDIDLSLTAKERTAFLLGRCLDTLSELLEIMEGQESRMYSSSILIVYEGDPDALEEALEREQARLEKEEERQQRLEQYPHKQTNDVDDGNYDDDDDDDDDDEEDERPRLCEVKLIDFAHAKWTPGQGPDENVLQGLRAIVEIFAELVEAQASEHEA